MKKMARRIFLVSLMVVMVLTLFRVLVSSEPESEDVELRLCS
jgi:hypothetical protein